MPGATIETKEDAICAHRHRQEIEFLLPGATTGSNMATKLKIYRGSQKTVPQQTGNRSPCC